MSSGHFGRKAIFGILAGATLALFYQPDFRKKVVSFLQEFREDFQKALREARNEIAQKELELKKGIAESEREEEHPNYIV